MLLYPQEYPRVPWELLPILAALFNTRSGLSSLSNQRVKKRELVIVRLPSHVGERTDKESHRPFRRRNESGPPLRRRRRRLHLPLRSSPRFPGDCRRPHPSVASNDDGGEGDPTDPDESFEEGGASDDRDRAAMEIVRDLMFPAIDPDAFRRRLATDVSRAAKALAWLRSEGGESAFRRAVMARLRATGYNAGICKARWDTSGGLAAGSYEYIDVVEAAAAERTGQRKGRRHIVDLDFAAEFKVARATEEYKAVVAALPQVAIAGEEVVRRVVREVADAARRSLRTQGLHVPPWRKSRYMLAKWLGPHQRTTSTVPPAALCGEPRCREYNRLQAAPGPRGGDANHRAVGFSAAPLPTARTR